MVSKHHNLLILSTLLFSSIIFSQTSQDLQKMRKEYESLKKNQLNQLEETDFEENTIDFAVPREIKLPIYSPDEIDSMDFKYKYFGYDFFTQRDSLSFWENLPAPPNYLLGPGDQLVVYIWGETQLRKTYTISRDGKMYDDKVGLLNLTGIPIDQAKKYLRNQFGRIYATLNGSKPSSYIDISLGELRSINVNFVGEVNYPGVYPIHPFSSLITGLIQAGGVDTTGSLRNIMIKRGSDPSISVDLYNYFLKGDLPKNIQLRDQDIVFVPVRLSSVTIDSNVYRSGIYESKSGETIKELIGYAGGLKPNAHTVIELKRVRPFKDRNGNFLDTESFYIDYSKDDVTYVQDGDQIKISKVFDSVSEVEIIGQVKRPGKYQYYKGMRLLDLIELSGGFNDSTFWKTVYQAQGELVRRNPDQSYEKLIKINLNKLKNGDLASNLKLNNLDRFVVHANRNFFEKENVQISG